VSAAKAVGAGEFPAKDGAALALAQSSSCTFLFFIGVTEDDHVAIAGWPKKTTVALTE
jgi:hypothetical protein